MGCPERSELEAYAAGLTEGQPARRLRTHARGCAACGALLAALEREERRFRAGLGAAAGSEEGAGCPEPEMLAAYAEGSLEAEDARAAVETHAARCGLCRDALADARPEAPVASPRALEMARQRIASELARSRSAEPARPAGRVLKVESGRFSSRASSPSRSRARAAARGPRRPELNIWGIGGAVAAAAAIAIFGIPWGPDDAPRQGGETAQAPAPATPASELPAPRFALAPHARIQPPTRVPMALPAPRPSAVAPSAEDEAPARADEPEVAEAETPLPIAPPAPAVEDAPATVVASAPDAKPKGEVVAAAPAKPITGLMLASVTGSLELRRAGEKDWRAVRDGDLVGTGDGLRPAKGQVASAIVDGRATLAFSRGSSIVADDTGKSLALSLERGAVEIALAPRADVIVRTPFAEATAQGSRFRVDRWNDELSVRSRAGPVHFAAAGATVVIASGQESSARAGKRPWEPRVPGEKSHRR